MSRIIHRIHCITNENRIFSLIIRVVKIVVKNIELKVSSCGDVLVIMQGAKIEMVNVLAEIRCRKIKVFVFFIKTESDLL